MTPITVPVFSEVTPSHESCHLIRTARHLNSNSLTKRYTCPAKVTQGPFKGRWGTIEGQEHRGSTVYYWWRSSCNHETFIRFPTKFLRRADKPTIPEVIHYFRAYKEQHDSWGSLHIVLDDGNVKDSNVLFCYNYALEERNDQEGARLAGILLRMSKTQRLKLGSIL